MIVGDFDVVGVALVPTKANSPLVVDADAVLTGTVATEQFEVIPGGNSQVAQGFRGIQQDQFSQRGALKLSIKLFDPLPPEETLCVLVGETADHSTNIAHRDNNVKRYVAAILTSSGRPGGVMPPY